MLDQEKQVQLISWLHSILQGMPYRPVITRVGEWRLTEKRDPNISINAVFGDGDESDLRDDKLLLNLERLFTAAYTLAAKKRSLFVYTDVVEVISGEGCEFCHVINEATIGTFMFSVLKARKEFVADHSAKPGAHSERRLKLDFLLFNPNGAPK